MFRFQRFTLLFGIIVIVAVLLASATPAFAVSENMDAPVIVAAEETNGSETAGQYLVIMMGLGAVTLVGLYYVIRQRTLSPNRTDE